MTRARRITLADAYPHLRGGSQSQLRWLVSELRGAGWDVRVIAPALGPLTRSLARDGVATVVVPATGPLSSYGGRAGAAALSRLPGYWRRSATALRGSDVVHLNDHRAVLLYGVPARLARAKVVWHAHALAAPRPLDRVCAAIVHLAVAPSAAAAARLRGLGAPVAVVAGHIGPASVRWDPRDPARIATVGRLHPTKGQDVLLEAVGQLRSSRPDIELDLVGAADPHQPAYERALRERSAARDLVGAVHFRGHVDDPWPLVARARVYVQPSRTETQGLAFAQALRVGIPAVASDLPALREQGTDGDAISFVPVEDVAALVAALQRALDLGTEDPDRTPPGTRHGSTGTTIETWVRLYEGLVTR
ncbi:MAG: glycosyltransferase family 4 protein [Actinobacteria bacterium]|nr:glycosyltransferase family 4 protein [Actinomycetota bacterium]